MPRPSDRDDKARRYLEALRIPANLGLNARRCKQEIDDDTFVVRSWRQQSYGRKATQRLLLERKTQRKSANPECCNERFSRGVVNDGDREVDIARKTGLRPN
jgi:hypothetical protein